MIEPDWNLLRAFFETADTGSLSAAARKLGQTQPTLSRQVAVLEQQLGVTLFERVGKRMVLTVTGRALLTQARAMRAAADALAIMATGQSQAVEGIVSVSASDVVSAHLLPAIVARLRQQTPGIVIEVVTTNQLSDLLRREADIAIRHVAPDQPDLIGRLICDASAGFYASSDWVAVHGHPRSASDAAQCEFIGTDRGGTYQAFLQAQGLSVATTQFTVYAENLTTVWEMARQGLGVCVMADEIAQNTPGMVRVLDEVPAFRFPVWLVTHRELHTARRIRYVFDILASELTSLGGSPRVPA